MTTNTAEAVASILAPAVEHRPAWPGDALKLAAAVDYAEAMAGAYLECAAWTTPMPDPDGPGDTFGYLDASGLPWSLEAEAEALTVCARFLADNYADISSSDPWRHYPRQAGHDLWLTRNRHGSGFWDRHYGLEDSAAVEAAGRRLTESAHGLGESYAFPDEAAGRLELE